MNVALYGRPGARWAMTERGSRQLARDAQNLTIGPSIMRWKDGSLIVDINEIAVPLPQPIKGRITLTPAALSDEDFAISCNDRHRWSPIAPCARITVDLSSPYLIWSGSGYLDSNRGTEPLETCFKTWTWSRMDLPSGDTVTYYDLLQHDGTDLHIAHRFSAKGGGATVTAPPERALPRILWGVTRTTRSQTSNARILKTLEDTPFYARSLIETTFGKDTVLGVHETVDLERFASPWVKCLLPFRMPRWTFG